MSFERGNIQRLIFGSGVVFEYPFKFWYFRYPDCSNIFIFRIEFGIYSSNLDNSDRMQFFKVRIQKRTLLNYYSAYYLGLKLITNVNCFSSIPPPPRGSSVSKSLALNTLLLIRRKWLKWSSLLINRSVTTLKVALLLLPTTFSVCPPYNDRRPHATLGPQPKPS